jgi:uncharacterized repeat protein (TIGR03803 family)
MRNKPVWRFIAGVVQVFGFVVILPQPQVAYAEGTLEVIHSFDDDGGSYPSTDLVADAQGNLYGMAVQGGEFGGGTVFRLSPTESGWQQTVLYNFTGGKDGGQPYGGVTLDAAGNIYGSAVVGGKAQAGTCPAEDGCGVVWRLSNDNGTWTHKVLHYFDGLHDGYGPGGPVVLDANGSLYGMTAVGGAYGLGTIYQIQPVPGTADKWGLRVIHDFTGGVDGGAGSSGRLLVDETGSLFGVATIGGDYGQGIVFKMTAGASGKFRQETLYSFKGEPDAGFPYGGLARDAAGNLYGTSYYSGAHGDGTVFQLEARPNGRYRERVLYSFEGDEAGAYPIGGLVIDAAGNLFGTTSEEGSPGCGCGTIYKVSPVGDEWEYSVVYSFTGTPDAAFSYSGLYADAAGDLYGTTVHGGEHNDGAAFKITP